MRVFCLLMLVGCGNKVDEADLPDTLAPVLCDQLASCAQGRYEVEWGGDAKCETLQKGYFKDYAFLKSSQGCSYDEVAARDCIDALDKLDCAEVFNLLDDPGFGCDGAWQCPG